MACLVRTVFCLAIIFLAMPRWTSAVKVLKRKIKTKENIDVDNATAVPDKKSPLLLLTLLENLQSDLENDEGQSERKIQGKMLTGLYETSRSSFPDFLIDVVKEIVAEFISERVESFFGFGERRSSSFGSGFLAKVINIVRKKAAMQKKGCL